MNAMQCPQCASKNVININLTMEDGRPVSFFSCHTCEKRWWDRDGEPLELGRILELAKRPKRGSQGA